MSGDPATSPTITAAMTQQGVILGTAAYMSPEQANGRTVDRRADVWAFGCVLFEMLSGRPAFGGENPTHALEQLALHNQGSEIQSPRGTETPEPRVRTMEEPGTRRLETRR